MRNSITAFVCITLTAVFWTTASQQALGQDQVRIVDQFKVGQVYRLLLGVTVKITGHVAPKAGDKDAAHGLMLEVQDGDAKKITPENIGDTFFSNRWGPHVERQGKKRARLLIQTPGTKLPAKLKKNEIAFALARDLDYERKEPGVWVPVGRPIPDWLKARPARKVTLSGGDVVWIEKSLQIPLQITKRRAVSFNLRGKWSSTGSRKPLELMRQFGDEKLGSLWKRKAIALLHIFPVAQKDGFHFRPQVRAFIVPRSADSMWLIQSIQQNLFSQDRSRASMIWYVPTAPFEKMSVDEIAHEAVLLHDQFGAEVADRQRVNKSIIMAIWPSETAGQRVKRYGTLFVKGQNGKWKLSPANKR